jgi:hypothetical protein
MHCEGQRIRGPASRADEEYNDESSSKTGSQEIVTMGVEPNAAKALMATQVC